MFFDDRDQALREMRRVLRPGGRIVVAVWDRLERTPGYAALTHLVERHLGLDAGKPIRESFVLGDVELVRELLEAAWISSVKAISIEASARFPSLQAWVDAEVRGWVGGGFIEEKYGALVEDSRRIEQPDVWTFGFGAVRHPVCPS